MFSERKEPVYKKPDEIGAAESDSQIAEQLQKWQAAQNQAGETGEAVESVDEMVFSHEATAMQAGADAWEDTEEAMSVSGVEPTLERGSFTLNKRIEEVAAGQLESSTESEATLMSLEDRKQQFNEWVYQNVDAVPGLTYQERAAIQELRQQYDESTDEVELDEIEQKLQAFVNGPSIVQVDTDQVVAEAGHALADLEIELGEQQPDIVMTGRTMYDQVFEKAHNPPQPTGDPVADKLAEQQWKESVDQMVQNVVRLRDDFVSGEIVSNLENLYDANPELTEERRKELVRPPADFTPHAETAASTPKVGPRNYEPVSQVESVAQPQKKKGFFARLFIDIFGEPTPTDLGKK